MPVAQREPEKSPDRSSDPGAGRPADRGADKGGEDRARGAAAESAHWLRGELDRLKASYDRQPRFFKMRLRIGVAFGVVAAFSLFMAAPPLNTLDAYHAVHLSVDRTGYIISVENQGSRDWTNVAIELDGLYRYNQALVRPGEPVQAQSNMFLRSGAPTGQNFPPPGYRPRRLTVRSDQGSYSASLDAP